MNAQTTPREDFDWSEVLPWTIIFKTTRSACGVTVIVLSLLGVLAVPMGWIASQAAFLGSAESLQHDPMLLETVQLNRSPYRGVFVGSESARPLNSVPALLRFGPQQVFQQMVRPFFAIFSRTTTTREFLYFLAGSLWSILVWSFIGVAIARVGLLKLTRNENAGLDDAFDYAISQFPTCILAIGMPLFLVALLCLPAFLFGLMLGFDTGALVAGALWFMALAIALLLGVLLFGLLVGWPLIVNSVAAEGQNAFDAVTRAYAYVFQRPLNYFLYALIALLFGGLCWLVVHQLTGAVIGLGYWSTSWGANLVSADRMDSILGNPVTSQATMGDLVVDHAGQEETASTDAPGWPLQTSANESERSVAVDSPRLATARRLIEFWVAFARTLAAAFVYGLFWCLSSAVYLLLRKDVDETEMDEIYVIDERRTYELPPLQSDKYGIPQVQPLSPAADDAGIDDAGNDDGATDDMDGET